MRWIRFFVSCFIAVIADASPRLWLKKKTGDSDYDFSFVEFKKYCVFLNFAGSFRSFARSLIAISSPVFFIRHGANAWAHWDNSSDVDSLINIVRSNENLSICHEQNLAWFRLLKWNQNIQCPPKNVFIYMQSIKNKVIGIMWKQRKKKK